MSHSVTPRLQLNDGELEYRCSWNPFQESLALWHCVNKDQSVERNLWKQLSDWFRCWKICIAANRKIYMAVIVCHLDFCVWSFCQGFASDSSLWTYHSPDANTSSHTRIQPTTVSPTYAQSADLSLPHSLMARQTHKEKLCHSEINGYVSAKQSDIVCCAYCSKLLPSSSNIYWSNSKCTYKDNLPIFNYYSTIKDLMHCFKKL